MAEHVQISGSDKGAKIRHPVAVALLSLTGIYAIFWWYFINREMADYGRAKGTEELGTKPAMSVLAIIPGFILIVPAIWTAVTTFKRVQRAQSMTGQTPISGWLGLVLYIVISPALYGYMQSGLNSAWRNVRGAAPAPAETA